MFPFALPAVLCGSELKTPSGTFRGGVLSPTGLFVPPLGEAEFNDLYAHYRREVRALEQDGVKFLLLEAQASLADMRAAALAARTTDLPVFAALELSASGRTLSGGELLPAVITLQSMGVEAVGLCCPLSLLDPQWLAEVLPHASVPLIVCTDPQNSEPEEFAQKLLSAVRAGAGIAGSYGGMGAKHLAALETALAGISAAENSYEDADCYAAATEKEAFFLGDNIEYSKPMPCTPSLAELLPHLEDARVNTVLVEVETLDDATLLAELGRSACLPLAVRCSSLPVLDAALRYFQGRLIIDSDCPLEEEEIVPLAAKYGAIIY